MILIITILSLFGLIKNNYSIGIFIDILIPIISSIIGGSITFFGVKKTIEKTKKENEEQRRLANKPYISIKSIIDNKNYSDITFSESKNINHCVAGVLKNTDNGIFLIKEVIINSQSNVCKPSYTRYIEKNESVILRIYLKKENYKDLKYIKIKLIDVFKNEYQYLLELSKQSNSLCMIKGIIEIEDE